MIFSARRELCPVLHSDALDRQRTLAFSTISAAAASLTSSLIAFSTAVSLIARSEEATQALTTPYVYPAECHLAWSMTSKAQNTYLGAIIRETFLFQDSHASAYLSCQPSRLTLPQYTYGHVASVYPGPVHPRGSMAHQVGIVIRLVRVWTGKGLESGIQQFVADLVTGLRQTFGTY